MVRAIPYDWRQGPSQAMRAGGSFDSMTKLIEAMVQQFGRPVVAVSMSLGGPWFTAFCSTKSSEWLDLHVQSLVSLSGPYGGTTLAFAAQLVPIVGWSSHTVPEKIRNGFMDTVRSFPSLSWMAPTPDLYGNATIVNLNGSAYTAEQLAPLLRLAGANDSACM